MELYDVMRTTFAAREFTSDPLPDAALFKILDKARFAPSGGNRQGWRVIVVRDRGTRQALAELSAPAAKRYAAQLQAGENPWNTIDPISVDPGTIERTPAPARLTEPLVRAPVVLVVCVDLKVVAATDQSLARVASSPGRRSTPSRGTSCWLRVTKDSPEPSPRWRWPRNRSCRSSWAFPGTSRWARSCRWGDR